MGKIYKQILKKIIVISDNHKIKHYADFYINHSPKFSKISDKDFLLIKKIINGIVIFY